MNCALFVTLSAILGAIVLGAALMVLLFFFLLLFLAVERVSIGQEEMAAVPEPFEWDPNDE
jgi:hypothetical protein